MKRPLTYLLYLFLIVFSLNSCGGGDDDNPPTNQTPSTAIPSIGGEGGTVTSSDGKVKVIIPKNALVARKEIQIEKVSIADVNTDPGATAIGEIYKLSPSGTKFRIPVEIELNHSDISTNLDYKKTLVAHWSSANDFEYRNIAESGTNKVKFRINNFSYVQLVGFDEEVTAIPDRNFEQALLDHGTDSDGVVNQRVLSNDIKRIKGFLSALDPAEGNLSEIYPLEEHIFLGNYVIKDLEGISGFKNLELLDAAGQDLEFVDVSSNYELNYIQISRNSNLKSVDLGGIENIITLRLNGSNIQNIDLNKLTKLVWFNCNDCNLSSDLDLSKNTLLETLELDGNNISNLSISHNTNLVRFSMKDSNLSEINLTNNVELKDIRLSFNPLKKIDLSKNINLEVLELHTTELTEIDVTQNTQIERIWIVNNKLSQLDVSQNSVLVDLWCSGNEITELNLSKNLDLRSLLCWDNQIKTLNLENNKRLRGIDCKNNQLSYINIKNGTNSLFDGVNFKPPFNAKGNKSDLCIEVDDVDAAKARSGVYGSWEKDDTARYSDNCN